MNRKNFLETANLRCAFANQVIVGLDPGRQRTGCAVMMTKPVVGVLLAKRLTNVEVCDLIWELEPDLICVEGFRLYPWIAKDKRWDHFPEIRIIGAVHEIARVCGIPVVEITPAQNKKTTPNEHLHILGTWATCHHTTDAFRVFWTVVFGKLDDVILEEVNDGESVRRTAVGSVLLK